MLRHGVSPKASFLYFSYILAQAVVLQDVVHVLIAAAGEVDEDGASAHLLGQLHAVGNRMGAFDGGDDALHARQRQGTVLCLASPVQSF